jgi:hypothetical protein
MLLGDLAKRHESAATRIREHDVEMTCVRRNPFEQRIKIREIAHIRPNPSDGRPDSCFGFSKLGLSSTGDEDPRTLLGKQFSRGEADS